MSPSQQRDAMISELQEVPSVVTGYALEFGGLVIFVVVLSLAIRSFFQNV